MKLPLKWAKRRPFVRDCTTHRRHRSISCGSICFVTRTIRVPQWPKVSRAVITRATWTPKWSSVAAIRFASIRLAMSVTNDLVCINKLSRNTNHFCLLHCHQLATLQRNAWAWVWTGLSVRRSVQTSNLLSARRKLSEAKEQPWNSQVDWGEQRPVTLYLSAYHWNNGWGMRNKVEV